MPEFSPDALILVVIFFLPFLFSLCFHEFAHAWTAKKFGDNTAEVMGRLSLNPMVHADIIGTIVLPILSILTHLPLFGWAKPVPVNTRNLSHPKQQMFWIALAGPLSNVLLYVLGLFAYFIILKQHFIVPSANMMAMVGMFLRLNLYLAFFNLIPLHPLDGGKVIARFLPYTWERWLDEKQYILQMVLLLMVIFGGLSILALPVQWIMEHTVGFVERL